LLERAADLSSIDTSARLWLGLSWLDLGFAERALPHLQQAHESDPLVPSNKGYLGLAHASLGRIKEGRELMLRAVEISGTPLWAAVLAAGLANADDESGTIDLLVEAQAYLSGSDSEFIARMVKVFNDPSERDDFLADNFEATQRGSAMEMLAALMFKDPDSVFSNSGPRASFEFMTSTSWLPSLRWVREDPRFYALMQDRGIVGFWETNGFPPGCSPVDDSSGGRLDCSGNRP